MKVFIITVNQRDVLTPRLYKVFADEAPSAERLIELGANIHPPRKDKVTIDEVSNELARAISNAIWLRP